MRRLAPALALSVALAVIAAGCGGGQSAEEKYADSVCTDISNWKGDVQQVANNVRDDVKSPQAGTLAAIDAEIQKAVTATRDLATNLRSLEPPNSDEGKQAKQQLETFSSQLESTVAQAKQTVDSVPAGASVSESLQKLAPLAPAVQDLSVQTSKTLESVKASGGKIKEGFDNADSCKKLSSSSS
jgi:methyl-accepting chemotaxis protein